MHKTLLKSKNNILSWPKISAPLVNMIKEGCENYLNIHKNLNFHWIIIIKNGGKYHYEIKVFL